ncbi:MAG TPA: MerR family transcriptional regulator [Candidatus Methylomirabilis sp.]|nr:MerR family transcriptional regulator [Candidatus Methylomirabilis sp.]
MKPGAKELYHTQEFARLAGVTVRALHHYDRLGLLRPKQRSQAGYRLYSNRDFARLEQIVVLKFLGMPLRQIRSLLTAESRLNEALRRQKTVLAEKRRQIDKAIEAITNAQTSFEPNGGQDWRLLQFIIQEIEMQNSMDWTKKYYSPEAQAKVEERKKLWSPELQERVSREWAQLFADIESAIGAGEEPASAKAQALAARWRKLLEGFTGGDPEIQKGLNKMWADQTNWPDQSLRAYKIKPEVQDFIMKAMRAGK